MVTLALLKITDGPVVLVSTTFPSSTNVLFTPENRDFPNNVQMNSLWAMLI